MSGGRVIQEAASMITGKLLPTRVLLLCGLYVGVSALVSAMWYVRQMLSVTACVRGRFGAFCDCGVAETGGHCAMWQLL